MENETRHAPIYQDFLNFLSNVENIKNSLKNEQFPYEKLDEAVDLVKGMTLVIFHLSNHQPYAYLSSQSCSELLFKRNLRERRLRRAKDDTKGISLIMIYAHYTHLYNFSSSPISLTLLFFWLIRRVIQWIYTYHRHTTSQLLRKLKWDYEREKISKCNCFNKKFEYCSIFNNVRLTK